MHTFPSASIHLSLSLSYSRCWFARSMGTRHPDADDRTSCSPLDPFHDKDLSSIPATRLHRVTIQPSLNGSSRLSRCHFVLFAPEPFRRHEPPRRGSPSFSGKDRSNFSSPFFRPITSAVIVLITRTRINSPPRNQIELKVQPKNRRKLAQFIIISFSFAFMIDGHLDSPIIEQMITKRPKLNSS